MDNKKLIQNYYENYYKSTHYEGLLGKFVSHYHFALESRVYCNPNPNVLEVGGGSGEHVPFVKSYSQYTILDPVPELVTKSNLRNLKFVVGRGEEIPFPDNTFDRVIFTCVLLHVDDSAKALSEARRVLRPGGIISIYLPSDPGVLFRLVRHFGSHYKQKKLSGLNMSTTKYIWSLEHKNHCLGILMQIKYIFSHDRITMRTFPLPFTSWNFNLYRIFQIQISK